MKQVGIGTRSLNFLVDIILVEALAFTAFKVWSWYVLYWQYPLYNFWWFFAGALVIYYTFFESIWGRTPGKWCSFSKVVDERGKKPNFFLVLFRSLVRLTIIDMFFLPFLDKTLHDYLSKTNVVEA